MGKAASRPDLVRRAWDKAKKEGFLKTWQEAMGRLDTPTPLGYSSAGIVEQCGTAATEFHQGIALPVSDRDLRPMQTLYPFPSTWPVEFLKV